MESRLWAACQEQTPILMWSGWLDWMRFPQVRWATMADGSEVDQGGEYRTAGDQVRVGVYLASWRRKDRQVEIRESMKLHDRLNKLMKLLEKSRPGNPVTAWSCLSGPLRTPGEQTWATWQYHVHYTMPCAVMEEISSSLLRSRCLGGDT